MKSPLALESNILFIDDETDLLEVLTFQIKDFVKKCFTASSASEGLKILETEKIDLVVTDFKMPEMNGVELIAAIRQLHPGIPILMLTGFREETAILKALTQDLFDVVEKPIRPEGLIQRIQNGLLEGHLLEQLSVYYLAHAKVEDRLQYEKADANEQRKQLYSMAGMLPRIRHK